MSKTSTTISNTSSTKDLKSHTSSNCNQEYHDRSGLWKHKKTCLSTISSNTQKHHDFKSKKVGDYNLDDDEKFTKKVILLMLQQSNKLQDALIDMSKQILTTKINNINNTINSNNN
jgi:hypothetical protein